MRPKESRHEVVASTADGLKITVTTPRSTPCFSPIVGSQLEYEQPSILSRNHVARQYPASSVEQPLSPSHSIGRRKQWWKGRLSSFNDLSMAKAPEPRYPHSNSSVSLRRQQSMSAPASRVTSATHFPDESKPTIQRLQSSVSKMQKRSFTAIRKRFYKTPVPPVPQSIPPAPLDIPTPPSCVAPVSRSDSYFFEHVFRRHQDLASCDPSCSPKYRQIFDWRSNVDTQHIGKRLIDREQLRIEPSAVCYYIPEFNEIFENFNPIMSRPHALKLFEMTRRDETVKDNVGASKDRDNGSCKTPLASQHIGSIPEGAVTAKRSEEDLALEPSKKSDSVTHEVCVAPPEVMGEIATPPIAVPDSRLCREPQNGMRQEEMAALGDRSMVEQERQDGVQSIGGAIPADPTSKLSLDGAKVAPQSPQPTALVLAPSREGLETEAAPPLAPKGIPDECRFQCQSDQVGIDTTSKQIEKNEWGAQQDSECVARSDGNRLADFSGEECRISAATVMGEAQRDPLSTDVDGANQVFDLAAKSHSPNEQGNDETKNNSDTLSLPICISADENSGENQVGGDYPVNVDEEDVTPKLAPSITDQLQSLTLGTEGEQTKKSGGFRIPTDSTLKSPTDRSSREAREDPDKDAHVVIVPRGEKKSGDTPRYMYRGQASIEAAKQKNDTPGKSSHSPKDLDSLSMKCINRKRNTDSLEETPEAATSDVKAKGNRRTISSVPSTPSSPANPRTLQLGQGEIPEWMLQIDLETDHDPEFKHIRLKRNPRNVRSAQPAKPQPKESDTNIFLTMDRINNKKFLNPVNPQQAASTLIVPRGDDRRRSPPDGTPSDSSTELPREEPDKDWFLDQIVKFKSVR